MSNQSTSSRSDGHSDVLGQLPEACRAAVLSLGTSLEVRKGKTLWNQGAQAYGLAIVMDGKVMSQYQARSGRSGTIGFWARGDLLGLGDMGRRATRQHTVQCLEDCKFHLLSFAEVDKLIHTNSDFSIAMVNAMAQRLSWVTQLALGLETSSAVERICTVLVALSQRFGRPHAQGVAIDLNLTNEQIAAIAGVTRQFTNATLKLLREREVIAPSRQLVIKDLQALAHLSFS